MHMKYKNKYDIGDKVKLLQSEDVLNIIKTMSTNTWINDVPDLLIELLNDNYNIALESIKYAPIIYFKLSIQFKNDNKMIRETIKAFKKHKRINELSIKLKPLSLK